MLPSASTLCCRCGGVRSPGRGDRGESRRRFDRQRGWRFVGKLRGRLPMLRSYDCDLSGASALVPASIPLSSVWAARCPDTCAAEVEVEVCEAPAEMTAVSLAEGVACLRAELCQCRRCSGRQRAWR